jgi:checkpoint serine/threonine-protein kinase
MLVDFGRSVDLEALNTSFPLHVKFNGPATSKDMECVSMRENRNWSLNLDTFGLCASAYVMLYGTHMEVSKASSTMVWKTCKPLRRYWNRTLWNLLFETLLNGGIEESQPKRLNEIRSSFDEYLDDKNRRREILALLKHQAAMLPKIKQ